ncbi:hypothetical protein LI291_10160 [Intestinibacillus massiliensis]|uniref:hypothetical protein n=1 Tax=Intestinibacillus massiliensis TaxID=1871029 RepID=UPI000B35C980|nr:hypothetical protein [Intestinibacillus massiliensis]MCB6366534.1 hypothetical protein [Intestinibacillus massiliensis]
MKKVLGGILALCLLCGALAGCGGGTDVKNAEYVTKHFNDTVSGDIQADDFRTINGDGEPTLYATSLSANGEKCGALWLEDNDDGTLLNSAMLELYGGALKDETCAIAVLSILEVPKEDQAKVSAMLQSLEGQGASKQEVAGYTVMGYLQDASDGPHLSISIKK